MGEWTDGCKKHLQKCDNVHLKPSVESLLFQVVQGIAFKFFFFFNAWVVWQVCRQSKVTRRKEAEGGEKRRFQSNAAEGCVSKATRQNEAKYGVSKATQQKEVLNFTDNENPNSKTLWRLTVTPWLQSCRIPKRHLLRIFLSSVLRWSVCKVNKGLVKKKCELTCSFVYLLFFVIVLFEHHA